MPCAAGQAPNPPLRSKDQYVDQAGHHGRDRESRSTSVVKKALPRNSNLARADAAATPNTRFIGTAIAAVMNVRRIALQASGSLVLTAPRVMATYRLTFGASLSPRWSTWRWDCSWPGIAFVWVA
jgi:hypothetical protein